MCGIAGIVSNNSSLVQQQKLQLMANALQHRGPDGEGFFINEQQQVGFAHRRLSVIDLSNNAAQPMHYLGRYTITYNGEIYNYLELKLTLQQKGYKFKSASDTEVILAAYDCYQYQCLQYFDGMFAFALYDKQSNKLFCARDRFGEKPFYYSFYNGDLYFASEMKALWAVDIEKTKNKLSKVKCLTEGLNIDVEDDWGEVYYISYYFISYCMNKYLYSRYPLENVIIIYRLKLIVNYNPEENTHTPIILHCDLLKTPIYLDILREINKLYKEIPYYYNHMFLESINEVNKN